MDRSLPNITAIRFFLALLVLLYHLPEFSQNRGFPFFADAAILHKGTEAVYAFFSLSGFLIIRNLYHEKLTLGQISIKTFYRRRILRIFPLYYAVLIFGLLYYNLILPRLGFDVGEKNYSILEAIFLGGTFFSNVLAGYNPGGIIKILWSIGIEEQFYLLIAPAIFLLPLRKIAWFLGIFTVVYFLMFNLEFPSFLKANKVYFYFFSISGMTAIFHTKILTQRKINWLFKILIFGVTIAYFFTDYFVENLSEIAYQFVSMMLFPLFIVCLIDQPIAFLQKSKLKYLGTISYGIYMLHAIVFQITGFLVIKVFPDLVSINKALFVMLYTIFNVVLTISLAHISYQYFESFFLRLNTKKED